MIKGIKYAKEASLNSYSPYSNFKVGACVQTIDNKFIKSANIENASYGLTCCAERNALFKVYSEGYKKSDIKAIYIYAYTNKPISPCGACRQVMYELMPKDAIVYLSDESGNYITYTVDELLPYGFDLDE